MTISELTHDQQVALIALVEAVALAGGSFSAEEETEIGRIAAELGDDAYRRLLDEAEKRFADLKTLKAFLKSVTDQTTRDVMFDVVLEEALNDVGMSPDKSALLDWLAETWQIEMQVEEGDEGEPEINPTSET